MIRERNSTKGSSDESLIDSIMSNHENGAAFLSKYFVPAISSPVP